MRHVCAATVVVLSVLAPSVLLGQRTDLTITNYRILREEQATPTQSRVTFQADVLNPGPGLSSVTAKLKGSANSMAGDKPENPFVGIPFPGAPLGLYNGRPWFLPFAGAWYKFLDWVS